MQKELDRRRDECIQLKSVLTHQVRFFSIFLLNKKIFSQISLIVFVILKSAINIFFYLDLLFRQREATRSRNQVLTMTSYLKKPTF